MGLGTSQACLFGGRLCRACLGMAKAICLVVIRQLNQQQKLLLNSSIKRTSNRGPQGVPKPLSDF